MRWISPKYAVKILNDSLTEEVSKTIPWRSNVSIVQDHVGSENKASISLNKGYIDLGRLYWGGKDFTIEYWRKERTVQRYSAAFAFSLAPQWAATAWIDHRTSVEWQKGAYLNLGWLKSGSNITVYYTHDTGWHHFAMTLDMSTRTGRFFVDGKLNTSWYANNPYNRSLVYNLYIGHSCYSRDYPEDAQYNNILFAEGICLYKSNFTPLKEKWCLNKQLYISRNLNVFGAIK